MNPAIIIPGALGLAGGAALGFMAPSGEELGHGPGDYDGFSRSDAVATTVGGGLILSLLSLPVGIMFSDTPAFVGMSFGGGAAIGGILGAIAGSQFGD